MTRLAALPFSIYSIRNVSRAADAQGDVKALVIGLRSALAEPAVTAPVKARLALIFARGFTAALEKARCYPWRSFAIPLLQVCGVVSCVCVCA